MQPGESLLPKRWAISFEIDLQLCPGSDPLQVSTQIRPRDFYIRFIRALKLAGEHFLSAIVEHDIKRKRRMAEGKLKVR
jgi:hypothetical protein